MNASKAITKLTLLGLLLTLTSSFLSAQGTEPEKKIKDEPTSIVAEVDRKKQMENYKHVVELIEQNPNYSRTEKDSLIQIERNALKEIIKGKKKGRKYGTRGKEGRANGLTKKQLKAKREAAKADYQRSLEEINSNTKLTDEQKEAAKSALKAEHKKKKTKGQNSRAKMNSHGNGQGGRVKTHKPEGPKYGKELNPEERKARRVAARAEHARRLELIDANPDLSEAEKEAAKSALKAEHKKKASKRGKVKRDELRRNGQGNRQAKQQSKVVKADLTEKQKKETIQRLNTLNKKLASQKKRGKISEENYQQRKGEIDALLAKLK